MDTTQHCPGLEDIKNLKSFICICSNCGKEKEIFSDELIRQHICSGCDKELDISQCKVDAGS
jgi:hypothetical protein